MALVGFAIMAFGVAFSIKSNLGTSPISSVPYVASNITGLSVGTATIIMHCIMISLQILILRKHYRPFQLTQLLVALVFGAFTDAAVFCIQGLVAANYAQQWLFCLVGILLVGIGVSLEVTANFVVVAGEGLVLAICEAFRLKFGNTKVAFDVTLVAIAAVASFAFLGEIVGVREGTLAAALLVGQVAKFCRARLATLNSWIYGV